MQPYLVVQTVQMLTCKLGESGGRKVLKIRLSETESENDFMRNNIIVLFSIHDNYVVILYSYGNCPIDYITLHKITFITAHFRFNTTNLCSVKDPSVLCRKQV